MDRLRRAWARTFGPNLVIEAHRLQADHTTGDDIAEFQRVLNRVAKGWGSLPVEVTGVYDCHTRQAVRQFQRDALNINHADGFIGPATARALHIKLLNDS